MHCHPCSDSDGPACLSCMVVVALLSDFPVPDRSLIPSYINFFILGLYRLRLLLHIEL